MLPEDGVGCHRTAFRRDCRELVTSGRCRRWVQVHGKHPQTGEPVDRFDCVDNWGPLLLIENSHMQRQTAAAIESFRNEVMAANGFPDGHPDALPPGSSSEPVKQLGRRDTTGPGPGPGR